nr:reverse transcriptase domain-containing protein [Tanacetum cinerariifolium]
MLPVTQIDTFYNGLTLRHRDTINVAAGGTFMKRPQWSESSSSITSSSDTEIAALKAEMAEINKNLMRVLQVNQQLKAVTLSCETCSGPHSFSDCPATSGNTQNVYVTGAYQGMAECLALADLGVSINLIPLSMWNKLSLPDLSPTCMTLELVDRSISHPVGVAEDVLVKVGTFHFPVDFVVVDFYADPRVPLILERYFLKTERGLIDVFEGELTLRVGKEAITFNLDQTSRYSTNYNDMTANRIDVIDMACEEYSQEVLGFSDVITSGNPTPYYDPIVSTTSPTLTLFRNSDFLFEELDAFLALKYDPTLPKVNQSYVDTEGDILLLEAFLNDDPSLPPLSQENYLPQVRKELKIYEAESDKSSIDEPPKVKLKDLPPHLEYVFLEGDDKFPVIIAKDLCVEEKTALITVLKLQTNSSTLVKGQSKIHNVIKQEVLKILDAGLIYPITDSPWVSPVHCVPKKGGLTVVENEENEIILTRLVMGWRICIDYYQEKTTFTCPYRTFAYRHMPFGLCNAPGTFQRCMMAMFHDMIRENYGKKMLKRGKDTNLCLNWEKSHFMVKEGIVLGHKISKDGIEVDKAKVGVITKLPHPTTVKGIRSFLGHARFYRSPGQRQEKHFRPIHYASKTMTEAESNYTTTKKEMLAVVYAFEKFRTYLIMNKSIVYTDHSALKYLFAMKVSKARLLCWVLLLQEFTFKFAKVVLKYGVTHRLATPYHPQTSGQVEFAKVVLKYGVTHRLATPYHPQTSGQVEVSNYGLKRILERTVGKNHASWSDKLDDALWAFRTAYKTPIGCTPKVQLNELRDQVYENSLIYKEKTKRLHDSKIKDRVFNIGDRVLLFNSRLKIFSGKLKSSWSGPFTISYVFPYGTVELSQPDGPNFKVNGHKLKHYFGEDIPKMVLPDLQTFPKDH